MFSEYSICPLSSKNDIDRTRPHHSTYNEKNDMTQLFTHFAPFRYVGSHLFAVLQLATSLCHYMKGGITVILQGFDHIY